MNCALEKGFYFKAWGPVLLLSNFIKWQDYQKIFWTSSQYLNQFHKKETIEEHFKNKHGLGSWKKSLIFTLGCCEAELSPNTWKRLTTYFSVIKEEVFFLH